MKIIKVTEEMIEFDNKKRITYYHDQDCCESVYADFKAIDDVAYDYEFEEPLTFEQIENFGFRFGNTGKMVSVPCYNCQNGWYSDDLEIHYCGDVVITDCEKKDDILDDLLE